ncbi:hypothetical protein BHYA_0044g00230 [Botrytis hyacinthi]|uniref:Uncharacterized protein n=1 Tax=Botrytis hyacinthi TaxID=278943 RepID=A0A4Z1GX26_9HELO|nr:hypothetical protein BHYA_0044g00230 [Botrytis hyacinthi]
MTEKVKSPHKANARKKTEPTKPTPARKDQTHKATAHKANVHTKPTPHIKLTEGRFHKLPIGIAPSRRTSSSGKKRSPRRTKDFGSGAFENGGSPLQRPLSPSTEATEASSQEPKTTGTTRWQLLEKIACLNPGLRIPGTPP